MPDDVGEALLDHGDDLVGERRGDVGVEGALEAHAWRESQLLARVAADGDHAAAQAVAVVVTLPRLEREDRRTDLPDGEVEVVDGALDPPGDVGLVDEPDHP